MKAVVYKGSHKVAVENVPDPTIEAPTDAVVRITSTGLCGSDLHMYDGRTEFPPGRVLGHEPMGVIEEVGAAVSNVARGDRVVMPFNIACGYCFNCQRGYTSACLTTNPERAGAGYGYAGMGPYNGGQAEFLRVPFADFNCLKLPGKPGDHWEDDFVLLADIFPTGYHATELAGVEAGDSVAVFGAGPVGLLAGYSAMLKGASDVYIADNIPARLEKVESMGAIPIDFSQGDPVEQIRDLRSKSGALEYRSPDSEKKMPGVMRGIDAVGFQARDIHNPSQERPVQVLDELIELVNPTGGIGVIGVYEPMDKGAATADAKEGRVDERFGKLWQKGLSLGTGQTPVARYNTHLRDLIQAGRAQPSFIVSHHMKLDQAPEAYDEFDKRENGYTKIIFKTDGRTV
jgi:glutathione-independent formaldehyde dehydrogenase